MMEDRSYRLMTAAKELDVDVLVLAQMNRVGMDALNAKQPPQLNEIRGTDALSHVSHAVWIVRKHMEGEGDQKVWNKKLEIWHAKTRGRQAYWDDSQQRMITLDKFVESGILEMDYGFSSVGRDDTLALAKRGMTDTRMNF